MLVLSHIRSVINCFAVTIPIWVSYKHWKLLSRIVSVDEEKLHLLIEKLAILWLVDTMSIFTKDS